MQEYVNTQMETLRKKITKDLKLEFNNGEFVSQTDLTD